MTLRPLFALLAACLLCSCGKVSTLGHGRGWPVDDGEGGEGGDSAAAGGSVAGAAASGGATMSAGAAGVGGKPVVADPSCASAPDLDGDLLVNSDSDPKELVRNITGDVTIDASASVTNLSQLRCLETVERSLDIELENGDLSALGRLQSIGLNLKIHGNQRIRDLSDFRSLTSVGSALTIDDNDALVDLSGLEQLTDIFGLHITNNAKLETLDALSHLTTRGGDIEITGNGVLVSIAALRGFSKTNDVTISANPSLRALSGLEGISRGYHVTIDGNDALTNLAGLSGFATIRQLTVSNNPGLRNLDDLANLATLESVSLADNANLENIDVFGTSLSSLWGFSLRGSPKVSDLECLSKFTSLEGGIGLSSSGITTLNGLRNMERIGGLNISSIQIKDFTGLRKANIGVLNVSDADELLNVSGLSPDIHDLTTVQLLRNAKLSDLSGLSMLQSIQLLNLEANPKLESLAGLENLKELDSLVLTDTVLKSLAPLDGMQSLGSDADIEGNSSLSTCEIKDFVARTGAQASTVTGNGPCN